MVRKTSRSSGARSRVEPAPSLLGARTIVLAGLGLLLVLGSLIWYMQGGGWNRLTNAFYRATAAGGLRVEEIFITGRTYVPREELLETIGAERGEPILALDLQTMHDRLAENRWFKSVRVERHMPNVLFIALEERKPFALWQQDQKLSIIDKNGYVITRSTTDEFAGLPLMVGTGANLTGAQMLSLLDPFPEFAGNLQALVRVSDRRWDVQLKNGVTIRLPEDDPSAALERVSKLWQTTPIATRKIKVIDARLPDRVIIDGAEQSDDKAAG